MATRRAGIDSPACTVGRLTEVCRDATPCAATRRGSTHIPCRRRRDGRSHERAGLVANAARPASRAGRRACAAPLSMLLPSKAQIILFWGPEFVVFYNDAYRPVFGAKHPHALGLPGREAWSEIWDSMLHELLAGRRAHRRSLLGAETCCSRSSATASSRRRTSTSPTTPSATNRAGGRRVLHRHRDDRPRGRRAPPGAVEGPGGAQRRRATTREACVLAMETLAAQPAGRPRSRSRTWTTSCRRATPDAESRAAPRRRPEQVRELPLLRRPAPRARGRSSVVGLNPQRPVRRRSTGAFLELVAGQSRRALANARPTRKSASAPRRSPSSIAPRRRSSPTSATSSARRSR